MPNQKRTTKFYRRNEAEVMERLGLKPTKGSGSGWIEKEDGQNEYLIAQLKSTDAESIRINLLDLHKLESNAIVAHKIPVFLIQFLQSEELFIVVKPADLPSVAQYLQCGRCDILRNEVVLDDEQSADKEQRVIKSSTKARSNFYKEREKQWQKKN